MDQQRHRRFYERGHLRLTNLTKAFHCLGGKHARAVPKELIEASVADFRLAEMGSKHQTRDLGSGIVGASEKVRAIIDVDLVPKGFYGIPIVAHARKYSA